MVSITIAHVECLAYDTAEDLTGLWRPSLTLDHEKQLIYVFGGGGLATNNMHVLYLRTSKWETLTVSDFCVVMTTDHRPLERRLPNAMDILPFFGGTKSLYMEVQAKPKGFITMCTYLI